jgi:dTDP-4-dehydrorhamnose 3,5-epimerase
VIAETRVPIPMKPGRPARFDYEYERNGTATSRMASPTYRNCQEFELSSVNGHQLYIPKGFAHGFQTLSMMSKSITSFPNPTNRNRPSAFGMTIRLLELPSPCP